VVAALNAASAASREVVVLRVLSEGIIYVLALGLHFLIIKRKLGAKAAVPALTINRLWSTLVPTSATCYPGMLCKRRVANLGMHTAPERGRFCVWADG
jgi:hypothetical protein